MEEGEQIQEEFKLPNELNVFGHKDTLQTFKKDEQAEIKEKRSKETAIYDNKLRTFSNIT